MKRIDASNATISISPSNSSDGATEQREDEYSPHTPTSPSSPLTPSTPKFPQHFRHSSMSYSSSEDTFSRMWHSGSFDNLSVLSKTRAMASASRKPRNKQEELKLRNEMNNRKENFESVDFFSTIPAENSDDDDESDNDDDDDDGEQQQQNGKQIGEKQGTTTGDDPGGEDSINFNYNETQESIPPLSLSNLSKQRRTIWRRTKRILSILLYPIRKVLSPMEVKAIIFLAILGVLGALANLFTDIFLSKLDRARNQLAVMTHSYAGNYILVILYSICFACIAAACTHFISPFSGGSGIPEMKSILSGNAMERYLSFQTLCAKLLGIVASVASGLSIGRLGPFVHISSCIANQLMNIKFFRKLKKAEYERSSLLAAACASGVATAFGAPFGGVLFSIEVTATYYPVNNLSRCIFCTLFGSLAFYVWRKLGLAGSTDSYLFKTDFPHFSYKIDEIFLFIVVGIICGLGGAFFNFFLTRMVEFRSGLNLVKARRYLLITSVALITTAMCYPLDPLLRKPQNAVVNMLFSQQALPVLWPILQLFMMIVAKFILTPLALILPLASGVFAPTFTIGAGIGRLFGEVVKIIYGSRYGYIVPAYYSVVGASAMASGVTRSLSTIVIVFELTGQFSLMIPVMISNIVAVGVANMFNESIYDRLMLLRGLPYLTALKSVESHKMKASDIMRTELNYVTSQIVPSELEQVLSKSNHLIYPVVDNHESMILVGSVTRHHLQEFLKAIEAYSKLEKTKAEKQKELSVKQARNKKRRLSFSIQALRQELQQLGEVTGMRTSRSHYNINQETAESRSDHHDEELPVIQDDNSPIINVGSYSVSLNSEPKLVYKPPITSTNMPSREFSIHLDPSPLSISIFAPLTKLHFLFSTLRLSHIWITAGGRIVGVVAKKDMIDAKL